MSIISNFNNKEVTFLVYIIIVNIVSFFAFGLDKSKSKKNHWRISEMSLVVIALIGGAAGALLGMVAFKHKTNKVKFTLGIPIIFILNKVLELIIFNFLR